MRSTPVIRLRWPVGAAVLASAIAVGACEAVLSLGDLQSCDDCVGSQCPGPCAADGATVRENDASMTGMMPGRPDAGSPTGDGQDAATDATVITTNGDASPSSRVDLGLGSLDGGSYAWSKAWTTNEVNAVVVDSAGNTIVTGPLTGAVTFDDAGTLTPPNKSDQIFVTKLDPSGTILWSKSFGGTNFDSRGAGLAVDAQNAIYVAGDFAGGSITFASGDGGPTPGVAVTGAGARTGLLFKLDKDGTPQWARSFLSPNDTSFKCADVAWNAGAATVGLACQFDGTSVTTAGVSGFFPNHDSLPDGGGSDAGLDGVFFIVSAATGAVTHGNTIGAPGEADTLTGIAPNNGNGFIVVGNSNGGTVTQGLNSDAGLSFPHVGMEGRTNGFLFAVSSSSGNAQKGTTYGDTSGGNGGVAFTSISAQSSGNTMMLGGFLTAGPDLGLDGGALAPNGTAAFCMGATLSQSPTTSFVQMFNGYPDGGNYIYGVAAGPALGAGICAGQLLGPDDSTGDIDLVSPDPARYGGVVAELGAMGKLAWAHEIVPTTAMTTGAGGSNYVKIYGVAVAPNGGLRLVGTFRGEVDLPNGTMWSTALLPGSNAFVLAIGP